MDLDLREPFGITHQQMQSRCLLARKPEKRFRLHDVVTGALIGFGLVLAIFLDRKLIGQHPAQPILVSVASHLLSPESRGGGYSIRETGIILRLRWAGINRLITSMEGRL